MSGVSQEIDQLAAEYVLGTLDPDAERALMALADRDPAVARLIADWQRRLAPLSLLAPPAEPPADLWARIESAMGPVPWPKSVAPKGSLTRAWESVSLWRFAALSGLAAAAALAAFMFLRPPPAGPVAALVPIGGAAAAFVAERQPDGTIRVYQLEPVTVAQGKDLQLWALPPGATRPVSLGVLAAARTTAPTPAPAPAAGTQLLVSLEPRGGSPTGQPTGPVLYGGTLRLPN